MKKSSGTRRLEHVVMKINFSGLRPPDAEVLPAEIRSFVEEVREGLLNETATMEGFREYIARYPRIAMLQNAFSQRLYDLGGDKTEAVAVAEKCYRTFRDYPFARLGYAQILCHEGRYAEMGEVMEKFRKLLPHLYPKRKEFYYIEFAVFCYLAACYHYSEGVPQQGDMFAGMFRKTMDEGENVSLGRHVLEQKIEKVKAEFAGKPDAAEDSPAEEL